MNLRHPRRSHHPLARRASGALAASIVVWSTAAFVAVIPGVASAGSGPTVYGAGSTWSQIALDQWRIDVSRLYGLSINYQGNGSSAGRQFYIQNNVDFAVSEIPFQPEELRGGIGRSYQYLPIVAGGTSLMYHLTVAGHLVTNLQLSSGTISKIFTGRITNWNDPAIRADYGRTLPDEPITPVYRSDGSGTSAQFSAYLHSMDPSGWAAFMRQAHTPGLAYTSYWPQFGNAVGQRGSDGVANYVAQSSNEGSIGYVEAGYAIEHGFPIVSVKNASGNYAQPTAINVATALSHASLYKDRTQNLTKVYRAPEKNAYPISSYSYMITPTKDIDPAKGKVLGQFILYFACQGQAQAEPLGYSPLPSTLVAIDFDAVNAIKGHPPVPSSVNTKTCPGNPAVSGKIHIPSPNTGQVDTNTKTSSSGGGGGGASPTPGAGGAAGSNHTGQSTPTTGSSIAGSSTSASAAAAGPSTLPSGEAASLQAQAAEDIQGQKAVSALPLVIAGLAILALIFGPLFLRMRTKPEKR